MTDIRRNRPIDTMSELGKIPPQDLKVETALIGCLILYPTAFARISGIVSSKSFYKETNQIMFETIEKMYVKAIKIDMLTIGSELKSTGKLEFIGGFYAITMFTNGVVGDEHIETWAGIIQDLYLRRDMIRICNQSMRDAFDESTNYEEIYNKTQEELGVSIQGLKSIGAEKMLTDSFIDLRKSVSKPPTILSIKDDGYVKRLLTLGNFSCITGKAKSRKTFFLSLITSQMLSNSYDGKFVGEMTPEKNEILYFDTEQGEYDSYNVIKRIETMSGTTGNRLHAFSLRQFTPLERCQLIEYGFKLYGERAGLCVIDGIADLAFAINDEQEATRVTTILLRLSKVYNCHITTVIHQNKNDNFATGHLGSSIMKKAEAIISVSKKGDISEIACEMIRGTADFEPFEMRINSEGIPETQRVTTTQKQEHRPSFDEPIKNNEDFDTPF